MVCIEIVLVTGSSVAVGSVSIPGMEIKPAGIDKANKSLTDDDSTGLLSNTRQ